VDLHPDRVAAEFDALLRGLAATEEHHASIAAA